PYNNGIGAYKAIVSDLNASKLGLHYTCRLILIPNPGNPLASDNRHAPDNRMGTDNHVFVNFGMAFNNHLIPNSTSFHYAKVINLHIQTNFSLGMNDRCWGNPAC